MTVTTHGNPSSVVEITGDGGTVRQGRWGHAHVYAQLTNPSPAEVARVRDLTQRIIAVMESHGTRANDVGPAEHGSALIAAEAAA